MTFHYLSDRWSTMLFVAVPLEILLQYRLPNRFNNIIYARIPHVYTPAPHSLISQNSE